MNAIEDVVEVNEELIECVVFELEPLAVRREGEWALPGPSGTEIVVKPGEGDAVVTATLVELTEATLECRAAVAELLLQAQPKLRHATTGMNEQRAWVAARASSDELHVELACAVDAVFESCRAMAREAQALLNPELAKAYLDPHSSHVSRDA